MICLRFYGDFRHSFMKSYLYQSIFHLQIIIQHYHALYIRKKLVTSIDVNGSS